AGFVGRWIDGTRSKRATARRRRRYRDALRGACNLLHGGERLRRRMRPDERDVPTAMRRKSGLQKSVQVTRIDLSNELLHDMRDVHAASRLPRADRLQRRRFFRLMLL